MKPILRTLLISISSAVAGGALVFGVLKYVPSHDSRLQGLESPSRESRYDDILNRQKGIQDEFDNLFDDKFFTQRDPFEEMRKMRDQMERHLDGSRHNPFDAWFTDKFGGGTVNDISKREDGDFVYYEIKVDNVSATSINTKIENGYITITGTLERKTEADGGSSQSVLKSTFKRSFPLPEHVDQAGMQMMSEKDKIILKFPKIKS